MAIIKCTQLPGLADKDDYTCQYLPIHRIGQKLTAS